MRWTTSLHARFVHAVELLGGHESTALSLSLSLSVSTLSFAATFRDVYNILT